MKQGYSGEITETAVDQIIVFASTANTRVRMEARNDWILISLLGM